MNRKQVDAYIAAAIEQAERLRREYEADDPIAALRSSRRAPEAVRPVRWEGRCRARADVQAERDGATAPSRSRLMSGPGVLVDQHTPRCGETRPRVDGGRRSRRTTAIGSSRSPGTARSTSGVGDFDKRTMFDTADHCAADSWRIVPSGPDASDERLARLIGRHDCRRCRSIENSEAERLTTMPLRTRTPGPRRQARQPPAGGLPRRRRLRRLRAALQRDEARRGRRRGQGLRACAAAAGPGSRAGSSGRSCPKDHPGPIYLCVNADEREPCTFNNRILMEKDPHQVLEGIMLACFATKCADGLLLPPLRVRRRLPRPAGGDRRAATRPGCSARTSSARASTSTSSCTAGPGRTSAARRPG